ncbi:hypothetical protein ACMV5I_29615 [Serratia sp. T13T92]|uniref:hypothetical protein n=1 Tax=Serratia sp. T13T92 TaxID=3397496 RepID=UPI0039E1EAA9
MARDHGLEEILREDLEALSGLTEKLCLVVGLGFLIESLSLRLVMMGCWSGLEKVETVGHSNNQILLQ